MYYQWQDLFPSPSTIPPPPPPPQLTEAHIATVTTMILCTDLVDSCCDTCKKSSLSSRSELPPFISTLLCKKAIAHKHYNIVITLREEP